MKIRHCGSFGLCAFLCSCVSPPDASSGINAAEMHALVKSYYWEPELKPPTFAAGELERLMDRSVDPTLDGEYAEAQRTMLAAALATVDDETFAAALERRTPGVQKEVVRFVRDLWNRYGLKYPKTQALAGSIRTGVGEVIPIAGR